MDNNLSLSTKNVKDLIKLCSKNKVLTLQFQNLVLTFKDSEQEKAISLRKSKAKVGGEILPTKENDKSFDEKSTVSNDLIEDFRKTQLIIDDPSAFEKEMVEMHIQGATRIE
jgi:hypothetical protein